MNTKQVELALYLLDQHCLNLNHEQLNAMFENVLGIKSGDGYPITAVVLDGPICRARVNDDNLPIANEIKEIGLKLKDIKQGRCNMENHPVFYGANRKLTAASEVLQRHLPGDYQVTIGLWTHPEGLRVVNLVDGEDDDFKEIGFVHSMPNKYLSNWPQLPRLSAITLIDYYKRKFKQAEQPGLYNITNVLSRTCYCLEDVDGIGYASTSDQFKGYNVAIHNYSKLKCETVERWFIRKHNQDNYSAKLLCTGIINKDLTISW